MAAPADAMYGRAFQSAQPLMQPFEQLFTNVSSAPLNSGVLRSAGSIPTAPPLPPHRSRDRDANFSRKQSQSYSFPSPPPPPPSATFGMAATFASPSMSAAPRPGGGGNSFLSNFKLKKSKAAPAPAPASFQLFSSKSAEDDECEEEDESVDDGLYGGEGGFEAMDLQMQPQADVDALPDVLLRSKGKKDKKKRSVSRNSGPGSSAAPLTDAQKLEALVSLQGFSGAWQWEKGLLVLLGLKEGFVAPAGLGGESDRLATALVLAFLEGRLAGKKDEWEMLAEKARDWLAGEVGEGSVEGLLGEARKILGL